jgi:xanthine dehydrogenase iron-sulfur cluster and FAD-binding subunit A
MSTDFLRAAAGDFLGASLAGNLATASPISDMNPLLCALDASVKITALGKSRFVKVREFFLGYRKVPIHIAISSRNFFKLKIMRRRVKDYKTMKAKNGVLIVWSF